MASRLCCLKASILSPAPAYMVRDKIRDKFRNSILEIHINKAILFCLDIIFLILMFRLITNKLSAAIKQSDYQNGPKTAPLAAVCARYCQSVSHFTAKSDTQIDNSRKVFY